MKLPTIKVKAIVSDLASGMTSAEIERKHDVSWGAIKRVKEGCQEEIEVRKTAIQTAASATDAEKMSTIVSNFREIIVLAQAVIKSKIKDASPAQAAVIAGISSDKITAILGGPTPTLNIRFESKSDMIVFLKGTNSEK